MAPVRVRVSKIVMSSVRFPGHLTEFYRVYAISINPATLLIIRLGSIQDQRSCAFVYALATRSASGVAPLLGTSHTKSLS